MQELKLPLAAIVQRELIPLKPRRGRARIVLRILIQVLPDPPYARPARVVLRVMKEPLHVVRLPQPILRVLLQQHLPEVVLFVKSRWKLIVRALGFSLRFFCRLVWPLFCLP